uniref:Methyltransferase FkbM domain-containing protein n=1 Tax=viral metagenome TaxID=1070528 RepID=A0A6C0EVB3_9ZZZZ
MQVHSSHLGNYVVPLNVKNGVCIDIGGNTGQFSLKYKDFFKTIHIYEPQRECYEIIKKNIDGLINIKLFDEAVFHTSNLLVSLASHHNFDSGSVAVVSDIIKEPEWNTNILVESNIKTISLSDITERIGGCIDYMKVDCETSEYNLLMDKDLSKIKYMGIELHWQMGKDNFNKLVNHILKYFNNKSNITLDYPIGYNIECLFESKFI